jgi:type II secretory pathway pseudopilin PulG
MKKAVINITIWIILIGSIAAGWKLYFKEKQNSRRLTHNIEAIQSQAEQFKARNGQQAARIAAQEVTISELRKNTVLAAKLKNLYIKPGRVQSFTENRSQMSAQITAPTRDTFIFSPMPTLPADNKLFADTTGTPGKNIVARETEKIRMLDYSDPWITIQAELGADTGTVNVAAVDTIFTAIHQGRRYKPLLWIFSRRKLEASATNTNPYIDITVIQGGIVKN